MTKKSHRLKKDDYVWCYECGHRLGKWDGSDTAEDEIAALKRQKRRRDPFLCQRLSYSPARSRYKGYFHSIISVIFPYYNSLNAVSLYIP